MNKSIGVKLVTVVDDVLMRGSEEQSKLFYEQFEKRFQLKDPTFLTENTPIRYVGFDISMITRGGKKFISVDQDDDMRQFLAGMDISAVGKVDNPMVDRHYALKDDTPLVGDDITWYRSVIGALNYYSCATRYDISYAVSRLSQFSNRPTVGARNAVYKILHYLACHVDFSIVGEFGGGVMRWSVIVIVTMRVIEVWIVGARRVYLCY